MNKYLSTLIFLAFAANSCTNSSEPNTKSGEIPGALYSGYTSISVTINQQINTYISGGTPPYRLLPNYDSSKVSAVMFSAGRLLIEGIAFGNVILQVVDSNGYSSVKIPITVTEFSANPNPLTAVVSGAATSLLIDGGILPYSVSAVPDSGIASISQTHVDRYDVKGISIGATVVEIKDASNPPKKIAIPIEVVNRFTIFVTKGIIVPKRKTTTFTVSGGTPPYGIMHFENPFFATGSVSGSTVILTGINAGTTNIWMIDHSNPSQEDYATIVVTSDSL